MSRRTVASRIAFLLVSVAAARAHATPADILFLVDSSGSMARQDGGDTRLGAARRLATDVIKAVRDRHRVGLARFAQIDAVVQGGEGKRPAHVEDEKQCEHGANLLAALDPRGADEALRWLDGVEEPGNPEIVALGDSPLYRGLEVVFDYIRDKRRADPLRHCVSAYVVVITDGQDTCAAGGELRYGLAELAERGRKEEIHVLVLSYTAGAEVTGLVARIGQPATATPYGADQGTELVAAVKAIEGRLAPEACLASGVLPAQIGLNPSQQTGDGTAAACGAQNGGGCGCCLAGIPGRASPLLLGALVLGGLVVLRRRRALLRVVLGLALGVAAAGGCGSDDKSCTPSDAGPTLREPATVRDELLARVPVIMQAADELRRDVLAPLLVPEKAFAAVKDQDGCLALARSLGFEPYAVAQRGPVGCLATRRCNSMDKSLLLQACLKSKGASADLQRCVPDTAFRKLLLAEAGRVLSPQDLSAVTEKSKQVIGKLYPNHPGAQTKADEIGATRDQTLESYVREVVGKDVTTLLPLAALDAAATSAGVAEQVENALHFHFFVVAGEKRLDPTLAGSPAETGDCSGESFDLDEATMTLKVQILVQYTHETVNFIGDEHVVAEATITPHLLFGQTLSVGIVDASTSRLAPGLPPVASGGCLRSLIEAGSTTVRGSPFFIGPGDAASCPETPILPEQGARHVAVVTLRLTSTPGSGGDSHSVDRVLIDRYGHAMSQETQESGGPMYSAATARQLMPLRVDLLLASGILSPAALLDARLADMVARRPQLEVQIAEHAGLPVAQPPAGPPHILPQATIAVVARYAPHFVGSGLTLVADRPWLLGHVQRRGFNAAGGRLDIGPQVIFDVLDAPLLVLQTGSADDATRLRAQVSIGALVTEAETLAVALVEKVKNVVNAGGMLRDSALAGKWTAVEPGALDPKSFPLSARAAAEKHRGELLVATAGAQPAGEDQLIAWWRLDQATGQTHSEVRYDGTFYGCAAGVAFIADVDKCLWTAAALALADEPCDVSVCLKEAAMSFITNLILTAALGGLFSYLHTLELAEELIFLLDLGKEMFEAFHYVAGAAKPVKC